MKRTQVSDSNSGGSSGRNDEIFSIGASATLDTLPEDCLSMVVYHTSPRDACVVASVSKTVKSAAESDLVWEKFIPPEYSSLVPPRSVDFSSKKEMCMSLADDSVLIDDGKKSFWLEKGSGKKCYMLSAMDLKIAWIDDASEYWKWKKDPESKFEKVAKLRSVYWFEIRGKISCGMLSTGTHYSVYAVVKIGRRRSCGLDDTPMEAQVGFVGEEATKTLVLLEPRGTYRPGGYRRCYSSSPLFGEVWTGGSWMRIPVEEIEEERESDGSVEEPKEREDGWSETKLGNYYNSDEDCDEGYMVESYTIEFPVKEVTESVEEPKERGDGWSEVKLGNFYNGDGGCDEIEFSIVEIQEGNLKSGLILQGIEIRPLKEGEAVATTSGLK